MSAATGGYVYRDGSLKISTTDYMNQVTKARLVPDTPISVLRVLVPDGALQDVDSTVWTFEMSGLTDWKTGGLAKYLFDHVGEQVTFVLTPKVGDGNPVATFTVVAIPMSFGGEQGSWNTDDLTLGVVGAPVFSVEDDS